MADEYPTQQDLLQDELFNAVVAGDEVAAIAGINGALAKGAKLAEPACGGLCWAANQNRIVILRHLLALGHSLTAEWELMHAEDPGNPLGETALHSAAAGGHSEALTLLLAQPDARRFLNVFDDSLSWTPLIQAVNTGSLACVRLLLQAGADPDAFNEQRVNRTALDIAVSHYHTDIVHELLDGGADPDFPSVMQVTARMRAKQACPGVIREMIAAVPWGSRNKPR